MAALTAQVLDVGELPCHDVEEIIKCIPRAHPGALPFSALSLRQK